MNGFSAIKASSHNTRNNSEIRVRFFSERSELPKYKKHQRFVLIFSATAVEKKRVKKWNSWTVFQRAKRARIIQATTVKFVHGFSASEASSQNTRKTRKWTVFQRSKRCYCSRKKQQWNSWTVFQQAKRARIIQGTTVKFVYAFSASEASSQNIRNMGGKGITFYTLDRLISEKAIFRGKVIQYNFLGSIITFLGILNRRKTVKFVYYFSASEASSQNAWNSSEIFQHFTKV